ncbi:MAG: hypothetical protein K5663_02065 [Clostridiales bacterium]|nr:hypothetical protein [Clostridiales bacterium]
MKQKLKTLYEKWKPTLKKAWQFILNPHFLICFGIGWMITNGWAYICFGLGTWGGVKWLTAISTAYLAALWFPFTPEKIITVAIAIGLLKLLYPNDQKTLAVLHEMRQKHKIKKQEKNAKKAEDCIDKTPEA